MNRFPSVFCLVLFASLPYEGTAKDPPMDVDALQGRWTLVSIDGKEIPADLDAWFELNETTINGFDGCNLFGGDLSSSRPMRVGQRGCEDDGFTFPLDLVKPVAQLSKAVVEGDDLQLPLSSGDGVALFGKH